MEDQRKSLLGVLAALAATMTFLGVTFRYADAIFTPSFAIFVFEYGYFLLLGFILFLVVRRRKDKPLPDLGHRPFRLLVALYFLAVAAALSSVLGSLYERPLAYYALFSVGLTLLFVQVLLFDPTKGRRTVILVEALLVPVVNQISFTYGQPFLFGPDSTFHLNASHEIAVTGTLPRWIGPYLRYPWFQVWGGIAMLASGATVEAFVAATFMHTVATVLVAYLVLSRIADVRAALLGVMFVLASPTFMVASLQYVPPKSGLALLILGVWVSLKVLSDRRFWALYFLLFLAAFLYHPVFGFLLVIISLAGALASKSGTVRRVLGSFAAPLRRAVGSRPHRGPMSPVATGVVAPFLFSLVTYIAYLVYLDPGIFGAIIDALTFPESQLPALGTIWAPKVTSQFIAQSMLSSLGATAVLVLALPILLRWFAETGNPARQFYAFTYGLTLASISLVTIGDLFLLGPVRFLGSLDIFTAMAAGPGLAYVLTKARPSHRKVAVAVLLVFGLVMMSSLSYRVDANSHISGDIPAGLGYLKQDAVASGEFLVGHTTLDTTLYMDNYMVYWIGNARHRTPVSVYENPVPPSSIHVLQPGVPLLPGLYVLNIQSAHRQGWEVEALDAPFAGASQVYDGGNIRMVVHEG